jgi:mono/diheme cytochrome c family protein
MRSNATGRLARALQRLFDWRRHMAFRLREGDGSVSFQSMLRAPPRRLALVAALAGLAGCSYSALEGPYGTDAGAVARGQAVAERDCGSCHGLGRDGVSRFPGAPPFRSLRYDYNAIALERATSDSHFGLAGMPPAQMTLKDVGDVGAYVRSLKHPGGRR